MTPPLAAADHRPRVNAERRARMRRRLLEAAMRVAAEKGFEASQIDDVMKTAEVSRGGFYGHFHSMTELLSATGAELANETMTLIEHRVVAIADPAERIACGLLLYLGCARRYPMFARFIAAAGLHVSNPHNLVYEFLPPHIAEGNAKGRFSARNMEAAIDLLSATMLGAVCRMAAQSVEPDYPQAIVASILMGLGLKPAKAQQFSSIAVEEVVAPAESLLMRSHQVV